MFNKFLGFEYLEYFRQNYTKDFSIILEKYKNKLITEEEFSKFIVNNIISENENQTIDFCIQIGVGGQESKLFAKEMFDKYCELFEYCKWKFKKTSDFSCEIIGGSMAFKFLRLESGVHRIQRVPKTEQKGRIHTSAIAIFVFPKLISKQINLDSKEIRIDTLRSSGPGGQHVNRTESCVRVTHIPTGIQSICQEGRNQIENKKIALINLEKKLVKLQEENLLKIKKQFLSDSGKDLDRSDKLRTYNWKDNRITNHLIDQNFNLKVVFSNKKNFFEFIKENLLSYEIIFFNNLIKKMLELN